MCHSLMNHASSGPIMLAGDNQITSRAATRYLRTSHHERDRALPVELAVRSGMPLRGSSDLSGELGETPAQPVRSRGREARRHRL